MSSTFGKNLMTLESKRHHRRSHFQVGRWEVGGGVDGSLAGWMGGLGEIRRVLFVFTCYHMTFTPKSSVQLAFLRNSHPQIPEITDKNRQVNL